MKPTPDALLLTKTVQSILPETDVTYQQTDGATIVVWAQYTSKRTLADAKKFTDRLLKGMRRRFLQAVPTVKNGQSGIEVFLTTLRVASLERVEARLQTSETAVSKSAAVTYIQSLGIELLTGRPVKASNGLLTFGLGKDVFLSAKSVITKALKVQSVSKRTQQGSTVVWHVSNSRVVQLIRLERELAEAGEPLYQIGLVDTKVKAPYEKDQVTQ